MTIHQEERIQLNLVANVIKDWCKQKSFEEEILYNDAYNSGSTVIRFTNRLLESIFPSTQTRLGYWKNGMRASFEIINQNNQFDLRLRVSTTNLTNQQQIELRLLSNAIRSSMPRSDFIELFSIAIHYDNHNLLSRVDAFIDTFGFEYLYFMKGLEEWTREKTNRIKDFPKIEPVEVNIDRQPEPFFVEGGVKSILENRYERNVKARGKCIAIHGSTCSICGFNFGQVYGDEFEGKIEVHHLIPLNEIQKDYVVNPTTDLIPVCSNCHSIIHSRKDKVLTPKEVILLLHK